MRTWRVFVILAFAMAFGGHANAQTKLADDTVLASGEGFQITVKDFREYLERFEPLARHRTLSEETIRMIVGNLTNTAVFSAHAAQTKLEGLPHVERETRELAVRQLLIDHKAKADAIGDDEVKKYFEAHPERFLQGELRRASVILLKDKADAEKVLTAAKKADTKAFAELARSKSINLQTRMRGGDLRYFNRDGIPLPLLNMYAGAPEQAPKGSNIDPALVLSLIHI